MPLRTGFTAAALLLLLSAPFPAGQAAASPAFLDGATSKSLDYAIIRNGEVIGRHSLAFHTDHGTTEVKIDISVKVTALSVPVYVFEQHGVETWEGDRFKMLSLSTNDDGETYHVTAEAAHGRLRLRVNGQASEQPDMPLATLWRAVPQHSGLLLDPVDGKPFRVDVLDLGEESIPVKGKLTSVRHWAWDGELKRDLWFDAFDTLVQVLIKGDDGSNVYYVLK